ncbi:MAG: YbaB/EbfC family nucleoid-associated protein [Bacteroidia bacterium]|nr:YbaB/EbfC family nucleoid-associated protein [Bacteroidia bacterium]
MFGQLKEAQEKMEAAKKRLDEIFVKGDAGGGSVIAEVSASKKLRSLVLSDNLLSDKEQIEDLVVIAVNRALEAADKVAEAEMQAVANQLLPGGMGALGKMFGK